jgi:translation elongation factor Tu
MNKKVVIGIVLSFLIIVILILGVILFKLLKNKSDINVSNNKIISENSNLSSDAFLMPIEDLMMNTGKGPLVTGRIERGKVKIGDEIEIVGFSNKKIIATVIGIEAFRTKKDEAVAGENIGLLLNNVLPTDLKRGQVCAKINSIKTHKKIKVQVHILDYNNEPYLSLLKVGNEVNCYLRAQSVKGVIRKIEGKVDLKQDVNLIIELTEPVGIEEGVGLAIIEDEVGSKRPHKIASGKILEIIE